MNKENYVGSVNRDNEFLYIADQFKKNNSSIIYVARDDRDIFDIKDKLNWILPNNNIFIYRWWDQIPYDNISPSKIIQSERIKTLYNITKNIRQNIILTSVNSILQKTINKYFIKKKLFRNF